MSKKYKEIEALKKSFAKVVSNLKKSKDKSIRKSTVITLKSSFKELNSNLKNKTTRQVIPEPASTNETDINLSAVQPSAELISELKNIDPGHSSNTA